MTKEEKLQEAKRLYKTANADQRYVLECLFPELAESEDEEIRQTMINFFKSERIKDGIAVLHFGVNIEKMIAWLEKQGEKKSSDKVLKIRQEVYQSGYNDGYKHGIEDEKQGKPKWSEEDSLMIDSIIETMKWLEGKGATNMKIDWLTSLKQRMGGEE